MPTSILDDIVAEFQQSILRNERRAASEMVRVYVEGWKRVRSQLDRLQVEYDRAIAQGEQPALGWIYQNSRLSDMQELIVKELTRFSKFAVDKVSEEQARVITRSLEFSRDEMILQLGSEYDVPGMLRVTSLPVQEIVAMVGANHQPGSPLKQLFDQIKLEGSQKASDALIEGMMLGYNPRKIARMIRDALGILLNRALKISRTEVMRALRTATEENYKANADIVKKWKWQAHLDERTCPSCLAMHGKSFPLNEKMTSHPNCRCVQSPVTLSWEELGELYGMDFSGVEEKGPSWEELAKKYGMSEKQRGYSVNRLMSGEAYFSGLTADEQRRILGPAKWLAWKEGKFKFEQLSKLTYSAEWGEGRGVASLKDLLGGEEAKHYHSLAQWNKSHEWEEVERKTVGFSFLSGNQQLQAIEQARALGLSEEGWAKYREGFYEKWLKPYNLIDDLFDTIGYWGGPEPSFNLRVFGRPEDVTRFADAWGARYNQQAMAILQPNPSGSGGKFVWNFNQPLTDEQLNGFFGELDKLNTLKEVQDKGLFFGVTISDSKKMEYWYQTNEEAAYVEAFLQSVFNNISSSVNRTNLGQYEFYFRSKDNGDY